MGYVEKTLATGEKILERAVFNWTYSLGPIFWTVAGLAPILFIATTHGVTGAVPGHPVWLYGIAAIPAAMALLEFITHFVHLRTTEIVVTSNRFAFKTGLIARRTKEVSLNMIEEINLKQSVPGRMFGYGNIILRGSGVGMIELPDIDNPIDFRRRLESAKAALERKLIQISQSNRVPAAPPEASASAVAGGNPWSATQQAAGPLVAPPPADEPAPPKRRGLFGRKKDPK